MAKALAADAVEHAGHGHPGSAISLAPITYTLYQHVMKHDPTDPHWEGRDRFILSGGHASLAQYVQLYLAGYLTLEDIKNFRYTAQTRTPGHPEFGLTPGIETTTGPLGQGLASAVGFALGARYQRGLLDPDAPEGTSPFDHHIWVECGEGDVEEGISAEASSIAGNQHLGNLTVIFDANHIQIEGETQITFAEDILKRYEAYGWYTDEVSFIQPDGSYVEDTDALIAALERAKAVTDKPHFIKVDTLIAWPTPGKTNDPATHGALLGEESIRELKTVLGLNPDEHFIVDEQALEHTRQVAQRGLKTHLVWEQQFHAWEQKHPDKVKLYQRLQKRELPENFDEALDQLASTITPDTTLATRMASGKTLNAIAAVMPELWGGSADLGGANMTDLQGADSCAPDEYATTQHPHVSKYGRQLHFGVREFAMGAITNGIVLGSHTRPFGGTFFQFADYERAAVRLAALMKLPNLFVWTHDSVGLGQDGPTHQPVEHLSSYRSIPDFCVVRPADEWETVEAYRAFFHDASGTHLPTAMVLSRQPLPNLEKTAQYARQGVKRGAYIVQDCAGEPELIIMASGSELQLALQAAQQLSDEGIAVRVVSMVCMEWFEAQSAEYRNSILPNHCYARVAVEAGTAQSWYKYTGNFGKIVSIEQFGLQGEGLENLAALGITTEHVVDASHAVLAQLPSALQSYNL